jgi:hypothetical protein
MSEDFAVRPQPYPQICPRPSNPFEKQGFLFFPETWHDYSLCRDRVGFTLRQLPATSFNPEILHEEKSSRSQPLFAVMGTVGQANAAAILIDPDGAAGGASAFRSPP